MMSSKTFNFTTRLSSYHMQQWTASETFWTFFKSWDLLTSCPFFWEKWLWVHTFAHNQFCQWKTNLSHRQSVFTKNIKKYFYSWSSLSSSTNAGLYPAVSITIVLATSNVMCWRMKEYYIRKGVQTKSRHAAQETPNVCRLPETCVIFFWYLTLFESLLFECYVSSHSFNSEVTASLATTLIIRIFF